MTISIVIPNYNGEKIIESNMTMLLHVIKKYLKTNKNTVEILVVDDGSKDKSLEVLTTLKTKYEAEGITFSILENGKNLGFSSTVNRGVSVAKGEIVVLLNTDVIPEDGFLEPLLKRFSDTLVFGVGCMDKSLENGKVVLRGRGIGDWKRGIFVHARGEVDRDNTLWIGGGSGAFRKSLWEKIGGLDTIYNPFYWEDIDLSYRALKAGYKLVFENESKVVHNHATGAIKKSTSNEKIQKIAYRNQFIFMWKNITDVSLWMEHVIWLPYHFIKALTRLDRAFFVGFFEAVALIGKIATLRAKENKSHNRSDRAIVKEFVL